MRVVRGLFEIDAGVDAPAVSIGNFDGVHRGHQAVISSAVRTAREQSWCGKLAKLSDLKK